MPTRVLVCRVIPVVVGLALTAATLLVTGGAPAAAGGSGRLPDLDQVTPSELVISHVGPRGRREYRLGFGSAVSNVGDGPLVIVGHRSGVDAAAMVADQLVESEGAPQEVVPGVGELRYTVSPDHRHWHLLDFDRYELRRAGQRAATVSDRKTGFCLGDRYSVRGQSPPSSPPQAVYTSRCGLGDTQLLGIQEGISVGYGDYYKPNLEGQHLPLSGLRAGRYVLVHRVNVDRRLRELDYGNNAASLLLELRWRRGDPEVRILRQCPDTDRCDRRLGRGPRVKTIATGLEIPWEIAFLPDRRALVTERPGRIRLLERDGRLRREPVASVPVSARGEGGLLGLAPDPDFARNRFVYLYFTTARGMRLERWRFSRAAT